MSKLAIMLVLGTGSVFPQSSIHSKHSCSLPKSLDARVKSDPHKTRAETYMYYVQNASKEVYSTDFTTRDFWSISHSKESAFCNFYLNIIHELHVYIHVYNATIQALMSPE